MDDGRVLEDRYALRERIGIGATSSVYRADDLTLGREVAIKVFGSESEISDSARRKREARILAGLQHPAIVTLFDARLDADPPYLVMEYVRGTTLADRITAGPLTRDETRALGASAAAGLARAHLEGVIHRDVKPANLVIAEDASLAAVRLLDFGIAASRDLTHTRTGSVLGSATYLSPEQASGRELTPATDVYSLGLVLIECLTGRPAFPGAGLDAVAARLSAPPSLEDAVLAGEAPLLARMTAAEPADRPTAEEVARLLAEPALPLVVAPTDEIIVTQRLDLSDLPAPGPAADRPRSTLRRRALAGAAVVAFFAAAAGGTALLGWPDPSIDPTPVSDSAVVDVPAPADALLVKTVAVDPGPVDPGAVDPSPVAPSTADPASDPPRGPGRNNGNGNGGEGNGPRN